MKQFLSFVRKEFYHIFRDKRTMLILLAMPIIQVLLFGFAITNEIKNARIAIFDPSKDIATQHIKEKIRASHYFTITEELTSPAQINQVFKSGNTDMVVVFSQDFAENLLQKGEAAVQLVTDAAEPNQASMLTSYVTGILRTYQEELLQNQKQAFLIKPEVRMLYNPQAKSAYNFVPGVMGLVLLIICTMMTSISIVREKETGTMEVLLSSPLKPIYIILAKAVPYFSISIVNLVAILLLSVYILDVPIAGSLTLLVCTSLLFIFLALSLGLLISTLVDTQVAAMLASGMGLMMPVMILSGLIFPIESMPQILQWASTIIPARWYIEAVKKIMIQGVEIKYVAKELFILASMAIGLMGISLYKFKTRLE